LFPVGDKKVLVPVLRIGTRDSSQYFFGQITEILKSYATMRHLGTSKYMIALATNLKKVQKRLMRQILEIYRISFFAFKCVLFLVLKFKTEKAIKVS